MKISVVLVSPKGASNVGGVARAMGNFGLTDLRIVKPRCNINSLATKRMSMASFPIIETAKIFQTFEEALSDQTYAIAFSGRLKDRDIPVGRPQNNIFEFAEKIFTSSKANDKIAFVFGREESGLRLNEINQCNEQVYIPTVDEQPSINLTSAVAISLASVFFRSPLKKEKVTKLNFKKLDSRVLRPTKEKEELFFKRIFDLLWQVKFLNPQNPTHLLEDLRDIFHRASVTERDLRILFGILTCIENSVEKTTVKKSC